MSSNNPKVVYSAKQLATRVAALGKKISRDYAGRTLDVVVLLENAFVFGADLVRHITCPVVCHLVRSEMRDATVGGFVRKEIFFSYQPKVRDRDVLVLDAVLHSGVTLEFLANRLREHRPRSLRVAVLLDRPQDRRVDLKPDYSAFTAASNYMVGYGLPGQGGLYRNLPYIALGDGAAARPRAAKGKPKKRAKRRGSK